MKNFSSFLFALIALLVLATACSNNPEDGDIATPTSQPAEGTALDPATCKFQWYESTDKLYKPQIDYDERCAVGIFQYLDGDEKPSCWADATKVEYYKNDKLVAKAEPTGTTWITRGVYYSLYDENGETIFEAMHNRVGDSDLPEYIGYHKFENGREVDSRADDIQRYDGVVANPGFLSYLDYSTLVDPTLDPHDPGYFVLDDDGLFEGCAHLVSLTDQDPVAFPTKEETPNGGNCFMKVEHLRPDGKSTFVGEYHSKYGEWWPSNEYEYDVGGKLIKKTERGHHTDGGYYLGITTYTYDSQSRLLSIDEDNGKEGVDGGDGVIEDFEHFTWISDNTAIILTQWTDGQGEMHEDKEVRTYDAKGRVTDEYRSFDLDDQPRTRTIRTYDEQDRQIYFARFEAKYDKDKKIFTFPDTPEYSSKDEYDAAGHLVKQTNTDNYSWHGDGVQLATRVYIYDGNRLVEDRWVDSNYGIDSRTLYLYHCEPSPR